MVQQRPFQDIHCSVKGITESLGYEFVGMEFLSDSGRNIFRIYIDSLGGINLDDCENVSRRLSQFLDEENFSFRERYFLEVSSPGLERPLFSLDDYHRFIGKKATIKTKLALNGKKRFTGILQDTDETSVFIEEGKGSVFTIPFDQISKGHLVFEVEKGKAQKHSRRKVKGD